MLVFVRLKAALGSVVVGGGGGEPGLLEFGVGVGEDGLASAAHEVEQVVKVVDG